MNPKPQPAPPYINLLGSSLLQVLPAAAAFFGPVSAVSSEVVSGKVILAAVPLLSVILSVVERRRLNLAPDSAFGDLAYFGLRAADHGTQPSSDRKFVARRAADASALVKALTTLPPEDALIVTGESGVGKSTLLIRDVTTLLKGHLHVHYCRKYDP